MKKAEKEAEEAQEKQRQATQNVEKSLKSDGLTAESFENMKKGTEKSAEEKKETPPVVAPGFSEADKAKRAKQEPSVKKFTTKVDAKKTQAAEMYKLGQYSEAAKIYKQAEEMIESALEDFPLFKADLIQIEATIFNNIAACAKYELNSKMEVEYTTKVIDR